VSFAHGSNDGQKGLGLIMLILVGTVPLAYALNRAMPENQVAHFVAVAQATERSLAAPGAELPTAQQARGTLEDYIRTKNYSPAVQPALSVMAGEIGDQVGHYKTLARVPAASVTNVRNDMYLSSEAIRLLQSNHAVKLSPEANTNLKAFKH